jgi:hypothetical protein
MYTDETVLVLNNPTLLKTLWRPLDVCSWLSVLQLWKVSFKSNEPLCLQAHLSIQNVFQSISLIISPSKFWIAQDQVHILIHKHTTLCFYK